MTHTPATAERLARALLECLREHGGFTIKGGVEREARAALAAYKAEGGKM